MKVTSAFPLLLLHVAYFFIQETESVNYSEPIGPNLYSNELGFGFATNYFKGTPSLRKYKQQNINDVYNANFRNLRLRCRADLYTAPYNSAEFDSFLDDLETVVDDCLGGGINPVISWIHHHAEAYASDADQDNYVTWWGKVAQRLKDKDYRLSFNLFTELGIDGCQASGNCEESLKLHSTKYNTWTQRVVNEIRNSGGNNAERILILTSPQKTAKGLKLINASIYQNDSYMMAEFHIYASGPNKKAGSPKFWEGNGTTAQRQTLVDEIATAKNDIPLKLFFAAWMPTDNKGGALNQTEVENFAKYFVSVMKNESIPSAMNVLDAYYNTKQMSWITDIQTIAGQALNMSSVLGAIKNSI